MRGKLGQKTPTVIIVGITPAGAGKTQLPECTINPNEDHPRRCGENVITCISGAGISGSPPQVRGKHYWAYFWAFAPGITPAGAGKTRSRSGHGGVWQDHPRGCGENSSSTASTISSRGSPPRMRGKLMQQSTVALDRRITPADAGKTWSSPPSPCARGDHPRGCGENQAFPLFWACPLGSPPRMRGKQSYIPYRFLGHGITPADAGKTPTFGHSVKRT